MFRYLEVRRQLVGSEDAQFDLREADLQVLEVVTFWRSCIFIGLLVQVFIHLLQLCSHRTLSWFKIYLHPSHRYQEWQAAEDTPASVCPHPKKLSSLRSSFSSMTTVKCRAVTMRCCENVTVKNQSTHFFPLFSLARVWRPEHSNQITCNQF